MSTTELHPSKLGTKEHWDDVYEEELRTFEEIGEEGEIWFGEESIEKMVEWSLENFPPAPDRSILEVGSGNGTLLFGLLEAGYDPKMLHGIDYSAGAVTLAKGIAAKKERGLEITFTRCDFLQEDPQRPGIRSADTISTEVWDFLMDKGTYDAIALGQRDENGNSPAVHYPGRVSRLLKSGGFFLITSCNFTEEELKANFTGDSGAGLIYHSRIQHPTFTFAGKSGSVCSSVAFRKK
ncbi:unnamed protein product [Cyclocybe aegerita]|uniref:Protein-lysine N-methyltransferase EFM4 n=1 Tax=Cyclocybe aegerita TaxID=1973307 RepID=A0A8S0WNX0_CYCAE|nr:unnamed protein product [Cyclocybe aegerita]